MQESGEQFAVEKHGTDDALERHHAKLDVDALCRFQRAFEQSPQFRPFGFAQFGRRPIVDADMNVENDAGSHARRSQVNARDERIAVDRPDVFRASDVVVLIHRANGIGSRMSDSRLLSSHSWKAVSSLTSREWLMPTMPWFWTPGSRKRRSVETRQSAS